VKSKEYYFTLDGTFWGKSSAGQVCHSPIHMQPTRDLLWFFKNQNPPKISRDQFPYSTTTSQPWWFRLVIWWKVTYDYFKIISSSHPAADNTNTNSGSVFVITKKELLSSSDYDLKKHNKLQLNFFFLFEEEHYSWKKIRSILNVCVCIFHQVPTCIPVIFGFDFLKIFFSFYKKKNTEPFLPSQQNVVYFLCAILSQPSQSLNEKQHLQTMILNLPRRYSNPDFDDLICICKWHQSKKLQSGLEGRNDNSSTPSLSWP